MTLLFLFLFLIWCSWFNILLFINSFGFKLGSTEFGNNDLMLLFKNLSLALPVISWDTVELILNTTSFKNSLEIPFGDFFKLFLSDPMALSAKEFDCGWCAEMCLCLTFKFLNFYLKPALQA